MRRKQNEDERIPDYASDLKETLYRAWPGQPKIELEELLVPFFIHGIYNSDTKAKLKFEGPTSLVKAMELAQIYEDVLINNSSIVNNTEFTTPPRFSFKQTPTTTSHHITVRLTQNTIDSYLTSTRTTNQRTRTLTLGTIDVPCNPENQRKLKFNNVAVNYIPDTGAEISVISEAVANSADLEIRPFDKAKVKVVTAEGNEVKDLLGFTEADLMLGNQKKAKAKMLVFKSLTNPCLIGRDILSTHPDTKHHFEALMGNNQAQSTQRDQEETNTQQRCKTRHRDRSSDDDFDDEMDERQDNSRPKGCWSKNKTMISQEGIQTMVPVNMDRQACKTKINNSVEKRTSTIENIYNCSNDHTCDENSNEINAVQCLGKQDEDEEEQHILICAIDLIINEEQEPMNSSLITSDESMVISPNTTINESWTTRKNKSRTRRRSRKLGFSDVSTPTHHNMHEQSSLMTSDMSQVTEIGESNDTSDVMLGENSQEEDKMETSTHDKSSDLSLGERSKQPSMQVNNNEDIKPTHKQNNNNPQTTS